MLFYILAEYFFRLKSINNLDSVGQRFRCNNSDKLQHGWNKHSMDEDRRKLMLSFFVKIRALILLAWIKIESFRKSFLKFEKCLIYSYVITCLRWYQTKSLFSSNFIFLSSLVIEFWDCGIKNKHTTSYTLHLSKNIERKIFHKLFCFMDWIHRV